MPFFFDDAVRALEGTVVHVHGGRSALTSTCEHGGGDGVMRGWGRLSPAVRPKGPTRHRRPSGPRGETGTTFTREGTCCVLQPRSGPGCGASNGGFPGAAQPRPPPPHAADPRAALDQGPLHPQRPRVGHRAPKRNTPRSLAFQRVLSKPKAVGDVVTLAPLIVGHWASHHTAQHGRRVTSSRPGVSRVSIVTWPRMTPLNTSMAPCGVKSSTMYVVDSEHRWME